MVVKKDFHKLFARIGRKLKKKFRFWRMFRRYFLGKRKCERYTRYKWLFEHRRLVMRQFAVMYGKGLHSRLHRNIKGKFAFGVKFSKFLYYLEFRLNILVVRLRFIEKIILANKLIYNKLICVNGMFRHKWYLVKIGDSIRFLINFIRTLAVRRKLVNWRIFHWGRWGWVNRKISKKKDTLVLLQIFWWGKNVRIYNFIQLNYRICVGVLLRNLFFGEYLVFNNKRMITLFLLKKLYLRF